MHHTRRHKNDVTYMETHVCRQHYSVNNGLIYFCNNRNCVGGEDEEQSCPPRVCNADQFQCANGICINKNWLCDFDNDCGDMSDEPANCSEHI